VTAERTNRDRIRQLLSGGDQRGIADSNRVRLLVEDDPSLVGELAALTADDDWQSSSGEGEADPGTPQ
jgi:hypothetical protein